MAGEILVCPKCETRVLAVVIAEEEVDKCPECKVKYVVEKTPTLPKAKEV